MASLTNARTSAKAMKPENLMTMVLNYRGATTLDRREESTVPSIAP